MKSSLAQTFQDAADDKDSEDRIFPTRKTVRKIIDEAGEDVSGRRILVVTPYDEQLGLTEQTSTLLLEPKLKKEFDNLLRATEAAKAALLSAIKTQSGSKKDMEVEISSAIMPTSVELDAALIRIKREVEEQKDNLFSSFEYDKVFNDKVLSALNTKDLRVRPETLCRITEFSEHESNGRELDEGERVAVEVLPVLGQSAAAVEPGDGAFDHPTPGLDDEALHPIGSLDDLGLEIGQDAGQGAVKDRALIGAVGEQFPEKGKQTEQGRQQRETAVAILNVGGGDDAVQQQALRIDQNMPLLALDQLAGIEAVAVDASPPFSALFTL